VSQASYVNNKVISTCQELKDFTQQSKKLQIKESLFLLTGTGCFTLLLFAVFQALPKLLVPLKVIKDLFQVYNDGKNDRLVPSLLWFTRDDNASQARIAADIVSSMTDSQALNLHKRLFGISPGLVSEWL